MPNSGVAAVECHSFPNKKEISPILRIAGTPAITKYMVIRSTDTTVIIPKIRKIPATIRSKARCFFIQILIPFFCFQEFQKLLFCGYNTGAGNDVGNLVTGYIVKECLCCIGELYTIPGY